MGSRARIWCLITGYLTLIVSFIVLLRGTFQLVELTNRNGEEKKLVTNFFPRRNLAGTDYYYLGTTAFKFIILSILTALYGFLQGIVLCVGVYLRKREYLTIWLAMLIPLIVFTGVSLMLAMWPVVLVLRAMSPSLLVLFIPFFPLLCFIFIFPAWAVRIYRNELKV